MELEYIKAQAKKEIEEELFRDAVDKYKEKLRNKKSIWDRVLPYKILIVKKEK